jgi:glycosyltransferase involved in cell wall biosynthesis
MTDTSARVRVHGKQFVVARQPFRYKGVTYGTFAPRADGARFPDRDQIKLDFAAMHEAGFTVVRTYTEPPADLRDLAADYDLRLLAGAFWPDWRYLVGCSQRQRRRMLDDARREVRAVARRCAGDPAVLALSVGNEIPADVARWMGTRATVAALDELASIVREEDPELLVTYGNYPTTEYLPLDSFDFLTFNVFLERRADFRRYLTRLQNLAGDRPLVLGELGLHAGVGLEGERRQAEALDWQLETATERGVAGTHVFSWTDEWWVGDGPVRGWRFGLTRADRTPRAALDVVAAWNRRGVADLLESWPAVSVVICAYNAQATLDECLTHTCALDYPELDIIVVDDGSTDQTAAIARRHPGARLLSIPHGGLSVARNEGFRAARGKVVAYLDSDAYPTPEWPYFVVLSFDGSNVVGGGGPNVPPREDPLGAQQVALAPGGPVHVLVADDRAEHVPGCNMAFLKSTLEEVGGFDPVFTAAGDDVDLCWRVLDRGYEIGFHPAALVWHHRRGGLRAYLRQQRGYGRAEALVEARHPDRFTPLGSARWRGRIYDSLPPRLARQRVYRGMYGAAAYQSVYQDGGYLGDLLHQAGVPLALGTVLGTAPLAAVVPGLAVVPIALVAFLAGLFAVDAARLSGPAHLRLEPGVRFRIGAALMHLLQPLARSWGRVRHAPVARRDLPPQANLPGPVQSAGRGVLLLPSRGPREELITSVVANLRRAGYRLSTSWGWDRADARLVGSALVAADLVSGAFPEGCVQIRSRLRPRPAGVVVFAVALAGAALLSAFLVTVVGVIAALDVGRGLWRVGPGLRRLLGRWALAEVAGVPMDPSDSRTEAVA